MGLFYRLDVGISGFSFSVNSTGKEFAHRSLKNIFAECRHLIYSPLKGFGEHLMEGEHTLLQPFVEGPFALHFQFSL